MVILLHYGWEWFQKTRVSDPLKAEKYAHVACAVLVFLLALRLHLPFIFCLLIAGAVLWPRYGKRRSFTQKTHHAPPASGMTMHEARHILGVAEDASVEQIRDAHRMMILRNHPDQGGSEYIASKINQARDVLLTDR